VYDTQIKKIFDQLTIPSTVTNDTNCNIIPRIPTYQMCYPPFHVNNKINNNGNNDDNGNNKNDQSNSEKQHAILPLQFDKTIPNWTLVDTKSAIKYEWNENEKKWNEINIQLKVAPKPFGHGSLRVSYYCVELKQNNKNGNNTSNLSKKKTQSIFVFISNTI